MERDCLAGNPEKDMQGCAEGTCTRVLEDIKAWAEDESDHALPFLFLYGLAGTGKSTIARSIALWAEKEKMLGAQVYLDPEAPPNATAVLSTIASQFAATEIPSVLCPSAVEVLGSEEPIAENPQPEGDLLPTDQTINQLGKANPNPIILVIIDSLDSIGEHEARSVLEALLRSRPRPLILKVLFTGRPESTQQSPIIATGVQRISMSNYRSWLKADIHTFLASAFRQAGTTLGLHSLAEDWATEQDILPLVKYAGDVFGVASDFVTFVNDEELKDPRGQLDLLLEWDIRVQRRVYKTMDARYRGILKAARTPVPSGTKTDGKMFEEWYQGVVGAISLSRDAIIARDALVSLSGQASVRFDTVLDRLRSVLISRTFPSLHPCFVDFTRDASRCTEPAMIINGEEHHGKIASRCFVSLGLRTKLATQRLPFHRRGEIIDGCTLYAERNWAYHLARSRVTAASGGEIAWGALEKDKFSTWVNELALDDEGVADLRQLMEWAASAWLFIP